MLDCSRKKQQQYLQVYHWCCIKSDAYNYNLFMCNVQGDSDQSSQEVKQNFYSFIHSRIADILLLSFHSMLIMQFELELHLFALL